MFRDHSFVSEVHSLSRWCMVWSLCIHRSPNPDRHLIADRIEEVTRRDAKHSGPDLGSEVSLRVAGAVSGGAGGR